jgi:hypothetical protein
MNVEERFAAMEKRLQAAEDQLEIIRLLNSYGPAVDSSSAKEGAALWAEDGVYDVGGTGRRVGQAEIAKLYEGPHHIGMNNQGSSHLTATPRITVNGDTAEATAYSFVILHAAGVEQRFFIWRGAVNHWKLKRTPKGWRIVERYNRVMDGSPESHAVLKRGVDALA